MTTPPPPERTSEANAPQCPDCGARLKVLDPECYRCPDNCGFYHLEELAKREPWRDPENLEGSPRTAAEVAKQLRELDAVAPTEGDKFRLMLGQATPPPQPDTPTCTCTCGQHLFPHEKGCPLWQLPPFSPSTYPGEDRMVLTHPSDPTAVWYAREDVDALLEEKDVELATLAAEVERLKEVLAGVDLPKRELSELVASLQRAIDDRDKTHQAEVERLKGVLEKREARHFPVMDGPSIPWSIIARYERQAQKNHGQTLERLAERGGLSVSEAIAVLSNMQWRDVPREVTGDDLLKRVAEITAALTAAPAPGGWRPIEDARPDGTRYLLWHPEWHAPNTGHKGSRGWEPAYDLGPFAKQPTHFHLLPAAPVR